MLQHARACLTGIICAAAISFGGCSGAPTGEDGEVEGREGSICPTCVRDSARPASAGLLVAPTPCQLSERPSAIDAAAARALGFGGGLDVLERTFESPFEWKVPKTQQGGQASGYAPTTTVMGRTTISAIEHRVPSLAGCADSLVVTLDVSISTGDGALAVDGQLRSFVERGATAPMAWGSLDLTDARGTLRLSPPSWRAPLTGHLGLTVRFWPDLVRGQATIRVVEVGTENYEVLNYSYQPLEGRWAIDDCSAFERPMMATEPHATPDGRSADQVRTDLQHLIDASPRSGHWDGGAEVAVAVQLGGPTAVCVNSGNSLADQAYLTYRTELQVMTIDGRIRVGRGARAYAGFDKMNALASAFVEIYEPIPLLAKDFAAATGISGVDLGRQPAAFWHTEVYFVEAGIVAPHGEVGVEGVDLYGEVTGTKGAVTGPIASFKWH